MKCPACNTEMSHDFDEDWVCIEDEDGGEDEMRVVTGQWRCSCGYCIADWEDEYEFPEN